MDRTLYRVAAVIATAVLTIACADARADSGAASADAGTAGSEQASLAAAQPDYSAAGTAPAGGTVGGSATQAGTQQSQMSAPANGAAPQQGDQQQASQPPSAGQAPVQTQSAPSTSGPPEATATGGSESLSGPPASQSGAAAPSVEPAGGVTASLTESPAAGAFAVSGDPSPQPSSEPGTTASAPAPVLEEPIGNGPTGPREPWGSGQPDGTLGQLLPRVERELRSVQVQIEELQRRVVEGAPPPRVDLVRLRTTLEWIAPALIALEARLDAAGRLTPHLRVLLHRVRSRLSGTQASAARLITALRHSGARGSELRLLLQELESFGALPVTLALGPGPGRVPARAELAASAAYTQPQAAPAALAHAVAAVPPEPRATRRGGAGSSDRGGVNGPPPWSSVSGSTTASPGGVFFVAGLAALAALLIGLALPRLWSRVELPRGRRYAVVFLAPLERPG
jgi:hypothetical protein